MFLLLNSFNAGLKNVFCQVALVFPFQKSRCTDTNKNSEALTKVYGAPICNMLMLFAICVLQR